MAGGYSIVVGGSAITASRENQYVSRQVITRHANDGARNSTIATDAEEGMYSDLADLNLLTRYDGANWVPGAALLLGGTKWTGGGNLVTGLTTTELACMTAASVTIPPKSTAEISVGIRLLASVSGDVFVFRVRDTNAVGTQRGEYTWKAPDASAGYNQYFKAYYENSGASSVSVAFCVTAQRTSGTGSLTMIAGGSQHNTHLLTHVVGAYGVITSSATP